MKCPNDNETLLITERANIEIDYCPQCRGVWLDRGELDKIIDRDATPAARAPQTSQPPRVSDDRSYRPEQRYDNHAYKKRRKESFLGDLFDF